MDECDRAALETDADLAGRIAGGRASLVPADNGCCRVCGERIPAKRLAIGAGTCILCQRELEAARA